MTRKTLYLDGRTPVRVTRVGPALEVHHHDQSPAWFPLPRLSAIVCRGPVGWQGDALQACIEHGLVVAFLDLDDRCIGIASGRPTARLDLGSRLELASVRPGWEERYQTWLHAQQQRRARYTCQALGWPDERDLRRLRQRLHDALQARFGAQTAATTQRLTSLLQTDIAADLATAGLAPEQLVGLGPVGHLADDLLSLLQWPLRGRLLAAADAMALPTLHAAAEFYHQHLRPALMATCRRTIASLWSLDL
ncbi:CRISPR-associated endonuclease Cas1 [Immundisolibacter sp.]|uniref:CRISPR-associated endonuclease Cas1 n=1 Tax=Immundisolibacter sp. TaxID=1934948 RepID=UPI0026036752|nr:CRISPR-associated endonuclease Cas1 [Immundisolibacter sp.]MDD3652190.1 CRISPR-associated endonuclease Cas1 [Immundisolibacter sp.]